MIQHSPRACSPGRILLETISSSAYIHPPLLQFSEYLPARNEVFHIIAPLDPNLRLILQLRYRLADDICEEVDNICASVSTAVVLLSEGEAVLGDFEEGYAQRPDVGGDGVRETLDAFGLAGELVRGRDEG